MIYKKTIPQIGREKYWSVLRAPADKFWYYEHFALGQKLPLFLIIWFEQEPTFTICPIIQQPFIFPTAADKISLISVLCSIFKDILWMYDTVRQHSAPCFLSFSSSPFPAYRDSPNTYLLKIPPTSKERQKKKSQSIRIFLSALRQILYYDNEPLIFSVLCMMGFFLLLFFGH